jgi:hypothetical protein
MNWRGFLILVFGGMRGAFALVLALLTQLGSTLPASVADKILFQTAGIVLLTLLINGSTAGFVVKGLKLNHGSSDARRVLTQAFKHVATRVRTQVRKMKHDGKFMYADWSFITRSMVNLTQRMAKKIQADQGFEEKSDEHEEPAGVHPDHVEIRVTGAEGEESKVAAEASPATGVSPTRHSDPSNLRREILIRYISALESDFARQFASMLITRNALHILNAAAEKAQDPSLQEISMQKLWDLIQVRMRLPIWLCVTYHVANRFHAWLRRLHPALGITFFLRHVSRWLFLHWCLCIELSISVLSAKNRLELLLEEFKELQHTHPVAFQQVKQEVSEYQRRAFMQWDETARSYPSAYGGIQTRHARKLLLLHEREIISALHTNGMLDSNEYNRMKQVVERELHSLERSDPRGIISTPQDIVIGLSFFAHLALGWKRAIIANGTARIFQPGDELKILSVEELSGSAAGGGLLIIVSGIVKASYRRGGRTNRGMSGSTVNTSRARASAGFGGSIATTTKGGAHSGHEAKSFSGVELMDLGAHSQSATVPVPSPAVYSRVSVNSDANVLGRGDDLSSTWTENAFVQRLSSGAVVVPGLHECVALSIVEAFYLPPAMLKYLHGDAVTSERLWRAEAEILLKAEETMHLGVDFESVEQLVAQASFEQRDSSIEAEPLRVHPHDRVLLLQGRIQACVVVRSAASRPIPRLRGHSSAEAFQVVHPVFDVPLTSELALASSPQPLSPGGLSGVPRECILSGEPINAPSLLLAPGDYQIQSATATWIRWKRSDEFALLSKDIAEEEEPERSVNEQAHLRGLLRVPQSELTHSTMFDSDTKQDIDPDPSAMPVVRLHPPHRKFRDMDPHSPVSSNAAAALLRHPGPARRKWSLGDGAHEQVKRSAAPLQEPDHALTMRPVAPHTQQLRSTTELDQFDLYYNTLPLSLGAHHAPTSTHRMPDWSLLPMTRPQQPSAPTSA